MRLQIPLLSLSFGLCIYLILTLLGGPYSQAAYDDLDSFRDSLDKNVEAIESHQDTLSDTAERLLLDPRLIEVEARRLLLFRENEIVVRLPQELREEEALSPGAVVLRRVETSVDRRPLFRSIAIVAAIVCYFAMLLLVSPDR